MTMRWVTLLPILLVLERHYSIAEVSNQGAYTDSEEYKDNVLDDAMRTVPALVVKYGYPVEVHEVVTKDGYILTLHRIPRGRDRNNGTDVARRVVFMNHGVGGSSSVFVILGPGSALAYLLAEEGYDVWMGNGRGNVYSRRHKHLNPDWDKEFWKFSWEEIAILDLPACLDYIEEVTGQSQLHYVGHSQGTTTAFVLCSMKPDYNKKIVSLQTLGPAGSFEHTQNVFVNISGPYTVLIDDVVSTLGLVEVMPKRELLNLIGTKICGPRSPLSPSCQTALGRAFSPYFNKTIITSLLGHLPAGASIYQYIHYAQCFYHGKFRRYDHGMFTNLIKYKSLTPPKYDLSKVTAPVYIYYSERDKSVHWKDAEKLATILPNVRMLHKVEYPGWDHYDFFWGMGVQWRLYDKVITQMKLAEGMTDKQ